MPANLAHPFASRPSRRRLLALLPLLALGTALPAAHAAGYPERPITVIVPFPAGGSVDALMRALQPHLSKELGQTLVIENLGGAAGSLGAAKVASAAKDGYTVLAGSINDMVMAPVMNSNVRYKPQDFVPLALVANSPLVLVASTRLPAANLQEMLRAARAAPESLSYGSPGFGSFQHVAMEDLQARAKIRLIHAPYKGAGPLINDVLGGTLDMAVMAPSTALPHIQAGRLKALAVTGAQRLPQLKQVPALRELPELAGVEANGWIGLFAPRGLPADREALLRRAMTNALSDKALAQQIDAMGMRVGNARDHQGFAEQISREEAKVRSIAVKLQ